jgi:speckle-type POZ protein
MVDTTWMDQLWRATQTKQLTDVEFLVGAKVFAAHRFIVSARSPVFAAMFKSDMIEANTGTVTISDTDPGVFETFLKFLYNGTLEPFNLTGDGRLRTLAEKYQVDTLLSLCQSFPPEAKKKDLIELNMYS